MDLIRFSNLTFDPGLDTTAFVLIGAQSIMTKWPPGHTPYRNRDHFLQAQQFLLCLCLFLFFQINNWFDKLHHVFRSSQWGNALRCPTK